MPDPVTAADYPATDPSLANAMQPANQPNPTPPAPGSPEHQSLFNGWLDYLTHPEVQTALIQFGASMLQPAGWGQSGWGQVGQAAGEAGQAVGRYAKNEADAKKAAADLAAQQATTENEAKRTGIAAGQAAEDIRSHQATEGLTKEQQAEQARHDIEAERAQMAQVGVSGAGVAAENSRTAELARQFDLQQKADAAKALAAQPGTAAEVAEREAHAKLLQAQADAAVVQTNVTKGLTYAQRMLIAGQKSHMDAWELSHNFETPEEHDAARNEEEQRYLSQDVSGLNPNAQQPPPATTAPAAGATTTAPAPAPVVPTPASGAPQPKKSNTITTPDGKQRTPINQLDPAAFAAHKAAGEISPEDEAAFYDMYQKAGTPQIDIDTFRMKVNAASETLPKKK